jgi:amino acid transporter
MTTVARKLRGLGFFTSGFGTMVGVGWLVIMDDWLERGGYLGAVLGFAAGTLLLLPSGYVYALFVMRIPDAGEKSRIQAMRSVRTLALPLAGW